MTFDHAHELDGPDGFPIRVRVRAPAGARRSVILCHGFKGWMGWGFFPLLADALAARSLGVVQFDLSGSGVTPDGRFADQLSFASNTFSRELRDLRAVLAEARHNGWVDGPYGLFGHSRGGGISVLHAGSDDAVAALVTWASISTIRRWSADELAAWRARGFLEVRNSRTGETLRQGTDMVEEVERDADGALDVRSAAAHIAAPWLILHGAVDETVSVDEAHALHAASGGRAELELLDTGHTFGASHPPRARPAVLQQAVARTVDFFAAHLT